MNIHKNINCLKPQKYETEVMGGEKRVQFKSTSSFMAWLHKLKNIVVDISLHQNQVVLKINQCWWTLLHLLVTHKVTWSFAALGHSFGFVQWLLCEENGNTKHLLIANTSKHACGLQFSVPIVLAFTFTFYIICFFSFWLGISSYTIFIYFFINRNRICVKGFI